MKKAQLFQQPLFYIFVLVVAALFLAWGVKSIFDLKARAETVELATSVQDLRNIIDTYYTLDYGSAKKINIRFPSKIEYICFTNNKPQIIPEQLSQFGDLKKLFEITKYNMFILPQTAFENNAFIIDHLTIKEDPLCFQIIGSLNAVVNSLGNSVEISKT